MQFPFLENVIRLTGDPTVVLPLTTECCPTKPDFHTVCPQVGKYFIIIIRLYLFPHFESKLLVFYYLLQFSPALTFYKFLAD